MSTVDRGLEQLKILFDYTKFHIGLYATVATIFAAAFASDKSPFQFHRGLLFVAVLFICLAGLAGGIIASSCAHFASRSELWTAKIGPFRWTLASGEHWTYIEHTSFWLAIAAAIFSVLIGCRTWVPLAACPA